MDKAEYWEDENETNIFDSNTVDKKQELKNFLMHISNRNMISDEGDIPKSVLRKEYRLYTKTRTPIINMDEFGNILNRYGFLEPDNQDGVYKLNLRKIQRLVHGCPESKDFQSITNPLIKYVVTIARKFNQKSKHPAHNTCIVCNEDIEMKNLEHHANLKHEGKDFSILRNDYSIHDKMFEITYELFYSRQEILFRIINNNDTGIECKIINIVIFNGDSKFRTLNFENSDHSYPFTIENGNYLDVYINKMYFNKSRFKYSILIQCLGLNNNEIIEQHHFWVNEALFKSTCITGTRSIILDDLPPYEPKQAKLARSTVLNSTNYVSSLMELVDLEDSYVESEFNKYDQFDIDFVKISQIQYSTKINSMTELPPKIEDETVSKILLIDMNVLPTKKNIDLNNIDDNHFIFAEVNRISDDVLIIDMECNVYGEVYKEPKEDVKYFIRFIPNRVTYRTEKYALSLAEAYGISHFFFPDTLYRSTIQYKHFSWFNNKVSNNEEQKTAIQNIVNGTAYPSPYIIFGPPGTGKTMTLVETIAQIYKIKLKSNILVTAPTNVACNEIAERLIKYIPGNDILRFYSKTKRGDDLHDLIYSISNLGVYSKRTEFWENLYSYRIVLCTLTTAGRLGLAKINPEHFNYVMIDECGSATESAALIPVVSAVSTAGEILANIVLTGDPKQLGPVVISEEADKLGRGVSMLERLMQRNIYKKNPLTNSYDSRIITKLVRNFRSHPAILHLSNELFYDNDLKCCGNIASIKYALNWHELPNKHFPIIFHCVTGLCRHERDMSLFNLDEIDKVIFYIDKLLTTGISNTSVLLTDIGVVTPYKKQCTKIRLALNKLNWNNIEVGSVEQYQGREKKIIILSTVRSNIQSMGFLGNEKRLNVALTRAQSLLIIVGNIKTLEMDVNWRKLIEYCRENNAIRDEKVLSTGLEQ